MDPAALLSVVPDPLFVLNVDGGILYANPAAHDALGWRIEDLPTGSVLDLVHPDDAMHVISSMVSVQGKSMGTPVEVRVRRSDGSWRWWEVLGRDCTDDPRIGGIVCSGRDLTRRRMWEVTAGDVEAFQEVVHHAGAVVLLLDERGVVQGVNAAVTRLLGHDPSIVTGTPLAHFVAEGDEPLLTDALAAVGRARRGTVEVPMRTADGRPPVPLALEIVNLLDDPVVHGFVVTGHDVSELHEAWRRVEYLTTHDPLTQLPNRSLLCERLEALSAAGRAVAVLHVDLERFTAVNERLGRAAGDEVLRAVAERLSRGVSHGDLVARLDGDEFAIVALDVTEADVADALAARLERRLSAPYRVRTGLVHVSATLGVAVGSPGMAARDLLTAAEAAGAAAKSRRSGSFSARQEHSARQEQQDGS